jgi:hypothetical protein
MGSGRTLRKKSHTRPIKSQGEKRRRSKVQRARLVKFGMDEAVVKKMQPEEVRVLVQHPVKVKKIVAAKAVKAETGAAPVKAKKPVKRVTKKAAAPAATPAE